MTNKPPKNWLNTISIPVTMIINANATLFLDQNFFIFAMTTDNEIGTRRLKKIELLAKAARWHGYTILVGFVPVRKINHKRLVKPNKSKFPFLNVFLNANLL